MLEKVGFNSFFLNNKFRLTDKAWFV